MQTNFSLQQLADPQMASSEKILRACVHCGFCTATCPTYLLLGDELDSPRGRIYLIKDMLENEKPANAQTVKHLDRCLSCLSCMTTCPSGVHYMHLIDHARAYIEKTYKRPFGDRLLRALLVKLLPNKTLFRAALPFAYLARAFKPIIRNIPGVGARLSAMLDLAPASAPATPRRDFITSRPIRGRVILLEGCAQPVLQPGINSAAHFLLAKQGVEVISVAGEGCCGALTHHMGKEDNALAHARHTIDLWSIEIEKGDIDAILITASGCGTTIKDYGFMFADDPDYREKAAKISEMARDISEYLSDLELPAAKLASSMTVAYHSACSMQHGQQIDNEPKNLLRRAGFTVLDVPEGHVCCGSAGVYNLLQPEIARGLRQRKLSNISRVNPDMIATGNIGCMTQLSSGTQLPVVHTVELLAWAYGGLMPESLRISGKASGFSVQTMA